MRMANYTTHSDGATTKVQTSHQHVPRVQVFQVAVVFHYYFDGLFVRRIYDLDSKNL